MKSVLASFIITSIVILTPVKSGFAQVGITGVPFLQIEPDSRAAGMGNAGAAIADNAAAIFWNPAGLGFQKGTQFSITHSNWLPSFNTDLFYDYVVGTHHIDGIGTVGGHVTFLNLGEQTRTNEKGDVLGTFRSYDITVGASYGVVLNDNLSLGTGLRFIYSNLAPAIEVGGQQASKGTTVGADIGVLYQTTEKEIMGRNAQLRAGFNLSNIGPGIQYSDEAQKDPLPTLLRTGLAYKTDLDADGFNTFTITADVSKIMARSDTSGNTMNFAEALFKSWDTYTYNNGTKFVDVPLSEQLMFGFGAEYWYDQKFALRGGYYYESPQNGDRQYMTVGAGLRYNMFGVDFSYVIAQKDAPLANTIRFSLLLNI